MLSTTKTSWACVVTVEVGVEVAVEVEAGRGVESV
jgi:hypothetical protein